MSDILLIGVTCVSTCSVHLHPIILESKTEAVQKNLPSLLDCLGNLLQVKLYLEKSMNFWLYIPHFFCPIWTNFGIKKSAHNAAENLWAAWESSQRMLHFSAGRKLNPFFRVYCEICAAFERKNWLGIFCVLNRGVYISEDCHSDCFVFAVWRVVVVGS